MRSSPWTLLAGLGVAVAGAAALAAAGALIAEDHPRLAEAKRTPRPWQTTIEPWDDKPREAVERLVRKYGEPHVAVPTMVVWYDNAPWKRTIVHRDADRHDFPRPHRDHVEQAVDYRLAPDRVGAVIEFDGSVHFARTAGELVVRGEDERLNVLTLNLAHEVAEGRLDVGEARKRLAEGTSKLLRKAKVAAAERLEFQIDVGGTADPDAPYRPATAPSASR